MEHKQAKIDPRILTTPTGAVIGWALARKIYGKDVSIGQELAGAGIGGGLGYAAGEAMRGDPASLRGHQTPADAKRALLEHIRGTGGRVDKSPAMSSAMEAAGYNMVPQVDLSAPSGTGRASIARMAMRDMERTKDIRFSYAAHDILKELARRNPDSSANYGRKAKEWLARGQKQRSPVKDAVYNIPGAFMDFLRSPFEIYQQVTDEAR